MNELSTKAAPKLPCDIVAGAPATPPLRPRYAPPTPPFDS